MRTAEIVSVGTELLLGQIVDTHAPRLAQVLASCGIACQRRATVGDNLERLIQTLRESLERADIVITIGGLGPTMDDLTRDGIAGALGDSLVLIPEVEAKLRAFFAERKAPWVESNARQALRPESGQPIDNPNGTAPGLLCQKGGKIVIAFPGPAGEFEPMLVNHVRPFLEELEAGAVIHSRILRIAGIGESLVESKVAHLMEASNPTVAPYAHVSEVHLRLTARAESREAADKLIDPVDREIRHILGSAVYGINETTLEAAVLTQLIEANKTVAVAESLTGGELGGRFTGVPGASKAFVGGVICYTDAVKHDVLGVSQATLDEFGAISEECATEMAKLARERFQSDYALALTGNAGPDASEGKPVGLVFVTVADRFETKTVRQQFRGQRADIRRRAAQTALMLLRSTISRGF